MTAENSISQRLTFRLPKGWSVVLCTSPIEAHGFYVRVDSPKERACASYAWSTGVGAMVPSTWRDDEDVPPGVERAAMLLGTAAAIGAGVADPSAAHDFMLGEEG